MAENCKTEIRKGTAYQSWDWNKTVGQGAEFKNLELASGGPWNTGLQGGDSKWQQEVWNCQPKVENFAEFEIGNLGESNWIYGKMNQVDSISLTDALKYIIIKYKFGEEFFKLRETLNLNLSTSSFDSVKLSESILVDIYSGYGTLGYGESTYGD